MSTTPEQQAREMLEPLRSIGVTAALREIDPYVSVEAGIAELIRERDRLRAALPDADQLDKVRDFIIHDGRLHDRSIAGRRERAMKLADMADKVREVTDA